MAVSESLRARMDKCRLCGSPLTLYFYPRPGPAPGNMLVCSNRECENSVEMMTKDAQQIKQWIGDKNNG